MAFEPRRTTMPRKRHKPEEIVAKLRQVDVLVSQGQSVAEAVRQVGNRSAQPRVLSLEILQSLDLITLEPAKLLAPAVVRDLRNPNRAYRLGNALPLRHQHVNLAQLRNNLLGLVSLPRHRGPPWLKSHTSGRTTSKGEDQENTANFPETLVAKRRRLVP